MVSISVISRRASSIRTRIKTDTSWMYERDAELAEHLPLEQGLRPTIHIKDSK